MEKNIINLITKAANEIVEEKHKNQMIDKSTLQKKTTLALLAFIGKLPRVIEENTKEIIQIKIEEFKTQLLIK